MAEDGKVGEAGRGDIVKQPRQRLPGIPREPPDEQRDAHAVIVAGIGLAKRPEQRERRILAPAVHPHPAQALQRWAHQKRPDEVRHPVFIYGPERVHETTTLSALKSEEQALIAVRSEE